jgi:hypothetical protein
MGDCAVILCPLLTSSVPRVRIPSPSFSPCHVVHVLHIALSHCVIWVCVAVDFFNQINMLYGTITDYCTHDSCPVMNAGPKYEYLWADGKEVKKALRVSAPEYIDFLMTWVQKLLDDETVFPSKIGVPFPKNFLSSVKQIFKRLFRVYAHIYHAHFRVIVHELGEEAHLNTSFKHFVRALLRSVRWYCVLTLSGLRFTLFKNSNWWIRRS